MLARELRRSGLMHFAREESRQSSQPFTFESAPLPDVWQRAAVLAAELHAGQYSPGTQDPYVAHVSRVAMLVSAVFGCHDPEVIASAFLHDVIEKSPATAETLRPDFGDTVAEWVEWLSKNALGPKSEYWDRLAVAPWQVRLIKLADAMDHLNGPAEYRRQRLKSARKAMALPTDGPPLLSVAKSNLQQAMERCAARE